MAAPKTLRPGDDDPEVVELQLRLRQLGLYSGDIDDNYDSQVEQAVLVYQNSRGITKDQDEPGVYGLVTRERLESETKEP
ncbi:peptidoglycan-binding protein [Streptomyces scabiei]|uniref:peptidoglycan-binding domain-containing protein n=1 Tax=Streptomyces scabiei TaxID=1930 RepID=UPI00299002F7|nr:peptidoglycan-binding protein [Streptomyces scabiei]MDW8811017.1 peptidoglycan-binding protein [Streptomyces scabiei]